MVPGAPRVEGTLASWNESRGFGFITPSHGGRDVFVHILDLPTGSKHPRPGDSLTFEVELSTQGKNRARKVLPTGAVLADMHTSEPRRRKPRQSVVGYLAVAAFVALYFFVDSQRELGDWVPVLYIGTSLVSILVYVGDKSAATTGQWRTSESSLLAVGLIGGWPGAVIAQQLLRHKTRKTSFQLAFWGTVALNIVAFLAFTSAPFADLMSSMTGT